MSPFDIFCDDKEPVIFFKIFWTFSLSALAKSISSSSRIYESALLLIIIAIHTNIPTLDTGGKIEIRGGKNAEYRSTRINGKGI